MGKKNKNVMASPAAAVEVKQNVFKKKSLVEKKKPLVEKKKPFVEKLNPLVEKKDLGEKNLDEFLNDWDASDGEDSEEEGDDSDEEEEGDGEGEDDGEDEGSEDDDEEEEELIKVKKPVKKSKDKKEDATAATTGAKDQKNYISRLKEKDPEFFEFLQENDQELLNFDESSDDEEEDDEVKKTKKHDLPDKLEVASDESDFEDGGEDDAAKEGKTMDSRKLQQSQIDTWVTALGVQPTAALVTQVMEAFRGAVATVGGGKEGEEQKAAAKWRVEGGQLFNSVVRLCVVQLVPSLRKVLRLEQEEGGNNRPEKSKHWKKLERPMRTYMSDLVTLLARVSETSVLCVLLKHTHSMLPFYQAFAKGSKQLLSRLVSIWSRGEETPRILAFMCIVKLVRGRDLLEPCIKAMYLAYVKNCKFTSPSTLQGISFMRRSLVELMGLDHSLAYYQAFVYIRQLAIHLRNAITCSDKKDSLLAVYNWQFVHSLELWGTLVGHPGSREAMQPLVYPLVQVVLGCCKLVPTPKYYPLRFHCARILRDISASTATFIPVLPLYLEVLNTYNFGKKSKKASMKPLDFSCVLKLSKSQLLESGMKDATMEEVYGGLLSYLADNSNRIGFPELVTPLQFQLKEFLKKCKVSNYTKKVKQVVDKTAANQKFLEARRRNVTFGVGDRPAIQVWESQVARDGTPLLAFYNSWKKISDIQHAKKVSDQANLDDYSHIPALKKNHKKIRMKREQESEVEAGFLSGSDDDFDDEENFKMKEDRGNKRKNSDDDESGDSEDDEVVEKKAKQDDVESDEEGDDDMAGDDEVEDLNLEDLDSDLEMDDEFGAADDVAEDNSEEDSDDDEDD